MKLTVLGSYGPYPPAGGACSGYLVEFEEWKLLLDCGNGVLSRLQHFIQPHQLDAVVLTHLHNDHISDCFILRYAIRAAFKQGRRDKPLSLYAPSRPAEDYERLTDPGIFQVQPIRDTETLTFGPLQLSFLRTVHSVSCYAVKITVAGSPHRVVYSGDTEYFPDLVDFAREASLLLCEANFLQRDLLAEEKNHMSARQAGILGKQAGVKKLVLTHLLPYREREAYLAEASKEFETVELAQEGEVYQINLSSFDHAKRDWKLLTVETNPIKASLLEGRLKTEGIPVMLRNEEAAGQIYGLTVGPLAEIQVLVVEDKIQQAREILQEINENPPEKTD